MPSRVLHRILALLLIGVFSLPAAAQFSRDASATKQIDEAINTHYLMMELDKAEQMLVGIVETCEMDCSGGVKAKAWMYVGIVRGSGKNNLAGAEEAFATAKAYDPGVKLDEALATPETKATFDSAGGEGVAQEAPAAAPAVAPAAAVAVPIAVTDGEIPGDMLCTPEERDILTRMPIPISCTSNLDPASAVLKFKEYGASDWKKVEMTKVGDGFRAEIPCGSTATAGPLLFYVGARNAGGEYVDQYGSKKQPAAINLSEDAGGPAPAFPGSAPVTRCASSEDCPPDFPGCAGGASAQCGALDWGASCDNSSQCKCGLTCDGGTCAQAKSCSVNEDCSGGGEQCINGYCSVPASASGASGPYKKHWLGATIGFDSTFVGGEGLCTAARANDYSSYCLDATTGAQFLQDPTTVPTDQLIGVQSGPAMGQIRIKLGYDYALNEKMQIGAKVGFAFANTPTPQAGSTVSPFLPVHLEGRFTYNFTPLGKRGFRPALFVNAGMAEVSTAIAFPPNNIYIHKRAGLMFFGGGANIGYAIKDNMNVSLDLGFQILTAYYATSVALHPALSFVYGL